MFNRWCTKLFKIISIHAARVGCDDYRGEVKAMYESRVRKTPLDYACVIKHKIKAGDRIAQMILRKMEEADLVEVDELSETERGSGGFGSTGTR